MNIKQEIANKLSVLIKDNDLKRYSGKDQFIAEIFKDFPFIKEEIVKITKELEEKVLLTLSEGVLYNNEKITEQQAITQKIIQKGYYESSFLETIVTVIFYCLLQEKEDSFIDFLHDNQLKCSNKEHFCWECSSRYFHALDLEKKEFVVYKDNHKCINLDNEFKVKIKVNGKIGISNFIRSINLPMNFDGPRLGTSLGDYNEMKRWAKKNVARFNVGNSSPIVWKKDEEIIIGNLFEDEKEYDYESSNNKMISEGYEKIGKITTDAWTVCVFNGKAKKDDAEIIIDTSFNTILVEQDQYKNIIKISGIK